MSASHQHDPSWSITGLLLIPAGLSLYRITILGISFPLVGLALLLYATHIRERRYRDEMESDTEIKETGAEGKEKCL